ncbi:MAG: hypothetical protein ACRDOK_04415 [Streptosporangiaceae bacterium]
MTGTTWHPARGNSPVRTLTLIGVLTTALISWAALPGQPGGFPRIALLCAAVAGLASLAQLALAAVPPSDDPVISIPQRLIARLVTGIQTIPWAEVLTVAVLVLEVKHPARAWHTGLLGVALLGYLFAVHLVETGARVSALRPQLPLLAAGLGLLALAVGAAAGPALPSGSTAVVVRVVAVAAAVVAGLLVVPVWLRGQRER